MKEIRFDISVMRLILGLVFFFALNLMVADQALAAGPPGPPGGGGDPPCWPPPCVPIDGGLSFLITAGLLYGGKKAYEKFKR